jgi:hypothetical protein
MRVPTVGLMLVLAAFPATASSTEIGILLDKQASKTQAVLVSQTAVNGSYDSGSPTGMGFRIGTTFLDVGILTVGVNATYHPKSEEDLKYNGTRIGKYGAQYVAVGAGLDWKLFLNLHAGVEFRRETYSADFPAWGSLGSTSLTRPWVKLGVGFSLPIPVLSPFVRLEVAFPSTKTDKTSTPDDLRQALAPQAQVAVYGGIRF